MKIPGNAVLVTAVVFTLTSISVALTTGVAELAWYGVLGLAIAAATRATQALLHRHSFESVVEDSEGPCVPVWLSRNPLDAPAAGAITGYFRRARKLPGLSLYVATGPQFHGFIKDDKTVDSTEGYYQGHLCASAG